MTGDIDSKEEKHYLTVTESGIHGNVHMLSQKCAYNVSGFFSNEYIESPIPMRKGSSPL